MANNVTLFSLFFALSYFCFNEARGSGFSVGLVHRDSCNPSITASDRIKNSVRRSISRAAHFKRRSASLDATNIQAPVYAIDGEYLVKLSIGTPPVEILGIVDTASDLTWIQSKPCFKCHPQESPLFDPSKSSTYQNLSCKSQACQALGNEISSCDNQSSSCHYNISYRDKSFSSGNLAAESFTLSSSSTSGDKVLIPKVIFGCGHSNVGEFRDVASGVIGLGGGPISLLNQFDRTLSIKKTFSYCLVSMESSSDLPSKLKFGTDVLVSGSDVVSTPLFSKINETFYFLSLEAITVGNKRLVHKSASQSSTGKGNIIIDAGIAYTFLPEPIFTNLTSTVKEAIDAKPVSDPDGFFSLCYGSTDGTSVGAPVMTAHFAGADVKLPPEKTFVRVAQDVVCLGMVRTEDQAIFGNLLQTNLVIGFDLENKKVSFKPTDCSVH